MWCWWMTRAKVRRRRWVVQYAALLDGASHESGDDAKTLQVKLCQVPPLIGSRVRIQGWVHRFRPQKTNYFIFLRDGTSFVQCILTGDCIRTLDALDLTVESTVEIVGMVEKVKEGQTAPGGVEVIVDWWKMVGRAPGGDESFEGRLRRVSSC